MASHLSTIGFSVDTDQEFVDLAERGMEEGEEIPVGRKRYVRWADPSGAELWVQVNWLEMVIGMVPHFSGTSEVRVGLTEALREPDDSPLDGAFHAWADPDPESPGTGLYPFVFDCPDAASYGKVALPSPARAQIAAFAHEIEVFADEASFEAGQDPEMPMASRSFIPIGLFSGEGEDEEDEEDEAPPKASALLSGHVRRSEERRNGLTGHRFLWAEVETLGGILDVVADRELLPSGIPEGGLVQGVFWLSGRLVQYEKAPPSLLRRLFG